MKHEATAFLTVISLFERLSIKWDERSIKSMQIPQIKTNWNMEKYFPSQAYSIVKKQ